jgi:hypothetical protein
MTRVVIAALLLIGVMGISIWSMHEVNSAREEIMAMTDRILRGLEDGDNEAVEATVYALCDYWDGEERDLSHFLRHGHMDGLSQSIAKLPPLEDLDDKPAFLAEVYTVRWLINDIQNTEAFSIRNIL